jgi:hypothetical protein|nr:hypothetical protein [Neorhizobium tomejilense]
MTVEQIAGTGLMLLFLADIFLTVLDARATFLACMSVSRPRGLMHSAAATTGKIA